MVGNRSLLPNTGVGGLYLRQHTANPISGRIGVEVERITLPGNANSGAAVSASFNALKAFVW